MRYSLLLPLVFLALAGCVSGGEHSTRSTSVTYATPDSTGTFLTPDQSSGLIIMPGDATSVAELRYLRAPH
jgi:hypothetical protein